MTSIKIAVLKWLRDELACFAMSRPWLSRLSLWESALTVRLDALREGGGE